MISSGIPGFDEITGGGLRRGAVTIVIGGAGTGKTIFGLQSLAGAAAQKELGLFVAFEESSESIRHNAATFSWRGRPMQANWRAPHRPRRHRCAARSVGRSGLADVYSTGGEVMMGTLRWQKEKEDGLNRSTERYQAEQKEIRAALAIEETRVRMQALKTELMLHQSELDRLGAERKLTVERQERDHEELRHRRGADTEPDRQRKRRRR